MKTTIQWRVWVGLLWATVSFAQPNRTSPGLRLWYDKPASEWAEALPLGNGSLGAMVFGDPDTEHLQINEDTLYSDEPGQRTLDLDVRPGWDDVRDLLARGAYAEADAYIEANWLGRIQPSYQPLGDLWLRFAGKDEVANYARELTLEDAIKRQKLQKN